MEMVVVPTAVGLVVAQAALMEVEAVQAEDLAEIKEKEVVEVEEARHPTIVIPVTAIAALKCHQQPTEIVSSATARTTNVLTGTKED